uniref:Uncharacterized protein n=1 Tax=Pittosporum tobira parvo-like virus TaxID=2739860 RepID=A0A6M9BNN9_9VIRU|nr:hypothetical protein 1 [Pittosporum tobira parvo-like virus]
MSRSSTPTSEIEEVYNEPIGNKKKMDTFLEEGPQKKKSRQTARLTQRPRSPVIEQLMADSPFMILLSIYWISPEIAFGTWIRQLKTQLRLKKFPIAILKFCLTFIQHLEGLPTWLNENSDAGETESFQNFVAYLCAGQLYTMYTQEALEPFLQKLEELVQPWMQEVAQYFNTAVLPSTMTTGTSSTTAPIVPNPVAAKNWNISHGRLAVEDSEPTPGPSTQMDFATYAGMYTHNELLVGDMNLYTSKYTYLNILRRLSVLYQITGDIPDKLMDPTSGAVGDSPIQQSIYILHEGNGSSITWKSPGEFGAHMVKLEVYPFGKISSAQPQSYWRHRTFMGKILTNLKDPSSLSKTVNTLMTQMTEQVMPLDPHPVRRSAQQKDSFGGF